MQAWWSGVSGAQDWNLLPFVPIDYLVGCRFTENPHLLRDSLNLNTQELASDGLGSS